MPLSDMETGRATASPWVLPPAVRVIAESGGVAAHAMPSAPAVAAIVAAASPLPMRQFAAPLA